MVESILVYDPTATCQNSPQRLREMPDGFAGKIVGFIDNSKPNFNYLIDDLANLLVSKYGVKTVVKRRKRMSSQPATDAMIKELCAACDVVITGSGD